MSSYTVPTSSTSKKNDSLGNAKQSEGKITEGLLQNETIKRKEQKLKRDLERQERRQKLKNEELSLEMAFQSQRNLTESPLSPLTAYSAGSSASTKVDFGLISPSAYNETRSQDSLNISSRSKDAQKNSILQKSLMNSLGINDSNCSFGTQEDVSREHNSGSQGSLLRKEEELRVNIILEIDGFTEAFTIPITKDMTCKRLIQQVLKLKPVENQNSSTFSVTIDTINEKGRVLDAEERPFMLQRMYGTEMGPAFAFKIRTSENVSKTKGKAEITDPPAKNAPLNIRVTPSTPQSNSIVNNLVTLNTEKSASLNSVETDLSSSMLSRKSSVQRSLSLRKANPVHNSITISLDSKSGNSWSDFESTDSKRVIKIEEIIEGMNSLLERSQSILTRSEPAMEDKTPRQSDYYPDEKEVRSKAINDLNRILIRAVSEIQKEVGKANEVIRLIFQNSKNEQANNGNSQLSLQAQPNTADKPPLQGLRKRMASFGSTNDLATVQNSIKLAPSQNSISTEPLVPLSQVKRLISNIKMIQKIVISSVVKQGEVFGDILKSSKSLDLSLMKSFSLSDELQKPNIVLSEGFHAEIGKNDDLVDLPNYLDEGEPIEHFKQMSSPYKDRFFGKDSLFFLGVDIVSKLPVCLIIKKETQKVGKSFSYETLLWTQESTFATYVEVPLNKDVAKPEALASLIIKEYEPQLKTAASKLSQETSFRPSLKLYKRHETATSSAYSQLSMKSIDSTISGFKILPQKLLKFEVDQQESCYKFGVLFGTQGQSSEEEMFNNRNGAASFDEFLSLLGEKIRLRGWTGYRGGLDAKEDTTGEYSIYRSWRGIQIMFHVSTLLPFEQHEVANSQQSLTSQNWLQAVGKEPRRSEDSCVISKVSKKSDDKASNTKQKSVNQQLGRKRHVGNDICLIVFLDGDTPYSADIISSHYCHVFAVVRPIYRNPENKASDVSGYSLVFVYKDQVPIVTPHLVFNNFAKSSAFFDLLICKLVNQQNASLKAAPFAEKIQRTRSSLLNDLVNTYAPNLTTALTSSGKQMKKGSSQSFTISLKPENSESTDYSNSIQNNFNSGGMLKSLKKAFSNGSMSMNFSKSEEFSGDNEKPGRLRAKSKSAKQEAGL